MRRRPQEEHLLHSSYPPPPPNLTARDQYKFTAFSMALSWTNPSFVDRHWKSQTIRAVNSEFPDSACLYDKHDTGRASGSLHNDALQELPEPKTKESPEQLKMAEYDKSLS